MNCGRSDSGAISLFFCLCMKYLSNPWTDLCHTHERCVWSLAWPLWKSRSPGTINIFTALSAVCVRFMLTSLASSCYYVNFTVWRRTVIIAYFESISNWQRFANIAISSFVYGVRKSQFSLCTTTLIRESCVPFPELFCHKLLITRTTALLTLYIRLYTSQSHWLTPHCSTYV